MKQIYIVCAAAVVIAVAVAAVLIIWKYGFGKANGYTQISQETAVEMMARKDGHVILDVRRQDEFDAGHIPGAICIPNESIGSEPPAGLPDLKQVILVYCRSGRRSKEAAQKLFDMGYTRVYEFGGILDWTGETVTGSALEIFFQNDGVKADYWFLPETEENKETMLWGKATVGALEPGETRTVSLYREENAETFLFRAIDEDHLYYEANGIALEDGCTLRFRTDDQTRSCFVDVIGADGEVQQTYNVFSAAL